MTFNRSAFVAELKRELLAPEGEPSPPPQAPRLEPATPVRLVDQPLPVRVVAMPAPHAWQMIPHRDPDTGLILYVDLIPQ
jgi:hypothetical protein